MFRNLFSKRRTHVRTIGIDILLELEQHQREEPNPKREVCGRIVVRDGVAIRYERLRNWDWRDYRFALIYPGIRPDYGLKRNEFGIIVHSHPGKDGGGKPSLADLQHASEKWLERPYGVFQSHTGRLRLYYIEKSRKAYRRIHYKTALDLNWPARFIKPPFPKYPQMPPLDKSL